MKYLLNAKEEVDLVSTGAEITEAGGRTWVRTPEGTFSALVRKVGEVTWVSFRGRQYRLEPFRVRRESAKGVGSGEVRAPMPGAIVEVKAEVGQSVSRGTPVVVLEAMKTRQPMVATLDGVVKAVHVVVGQQVGDGEVLVLIGPP